MPDNGPGPDKPSSRSPSSLEGLGKRIATARQAHTRRTERRSSPASSSGLGLGLRIATELVSALAVGVGIGLILDIWLGTAPWLLILFFILGAAAAMTNLIRLAKEAEAAQARERQERADTPREDHTSRVRREQGHRGDGREG